jgi:hypothetical protein
VGDARQKERLRLCGVGTTLFTLLLFLLLRFLLLWQRLHRRLLLAPTLLLDRDCRRLVKKAGVDPNDDF